MENPFEGPGEAEGHQTPPATPAARSTLQEPFAAVARDRCTHVAYLKANPPPKGKSRRVWYLYDIIFDGRVIIADSDDPECELARALLAEGITGIVQLLDAETAKPRMLINIEKAAKLTVQENRTRGPRFVKWKADPFPAERFAKMPEAR